MSEPDLKTQRMKDILLAGVSLTLGLLTLMSGTFDIFIDDSRPIPLSYYWIPIHGWPAISIAWGLLLLSPYFLMKALLSWHPQLKRFSSTISRGLVVAGLSLLAIGLIVGVGTWLLNSLGWLAHNLHDQWRFP